MKHYRKIILVILLAAAVCFMMTACGSAKTLTAKAFEGITEESGMHLECVTDVDGTDYDYDIYVKGENLYMDMKAGDNEQIMIVKGDTCTMVDPKTGKATETEMTDQIKTIADQYKALPEQMKVFSTITKVEKGTKKIDGVEYQTETIEDNGKSAVFVFNDDEEMIQWSYINNGQEQTMEVKALDGNVKDSQFEVPDTTSGKTGTDSEKNDTATGKTGGSEQTIINTKGGYTFKTDKSYSIDKSDQYTYVYLGEMSAMPSFNVLPMDQVSGSTVDSKIEEMIKTEKDKYQERIAVQPEKTTIHAGDRDVEGFDFAYSTEDGKDTVEAGHYFELRGDTFFSWNYSYVRGGTDSKAAMTEAMESFELD